MKTAAMNLTSLKENVPERKMFIPGKIQAIYFLIIYVVQTQSKNGLLTLY